MGRQSRLSDPDPEPRPSAFGGPTVGPITKPATSPLLDSLLNRLSDRQPNYLPGRRRFGLDTGFIPSFAMSMSAAARILVDFKEHQPPTAAAASANRPATSAACQVKTHLPPCLEYYAADF